MTYAQKLKDPRWQKRRLEVLNRDNWTCQKCKTINNTLHVHHKYYPLEDYEPWESPETALITLCSECHKEEHVYKNKNQSYLVHHLYNTGAKTSEDFSKLFELLWDSNLGFDDLVKICEEKVKNV